MITWLLNSWLNSSANVQPDQSGVPIYLSARIALAALGAFLLALIFGPMAIRFLKARFCERIDSASPTLNKLHAGKSGTPTMGGVFLCAACLIAAVLLADLSNALVQMGCVLCLLFTTLGFIDDWVKVRTKRRGLSARMKFCVQMIIASAIMLWYWKVSEGSSSPAALSLPILKTVIPLGWLIIPWGALVIVSTSNGVNLTDGLDGLATGCSIFCGGALTAICYVAGHSKLAAHLEIQHISGAGEVAVIAAALVGALLGFLWFNCHPAQVFMGDSGSLFIGAALGFAALTCRQELLLIWIGGVFVVETVSVILQLGSYRLRGKRILACSPLHNHFVFQSVPETRIVTRFWVVAALLAVSGIAALLVRTPTG